ncbi:hypothetical protein [Alkalibacillus silvisoli]|uniref:Uncharacterized protein n=1 Tax=Alkalibacillus silvisoli TaxID=392823 RepID=A0ABN0ZJK1_9BACI
MNKKGGRKTRHALAQLSKREMWVWGAGSSPGIIYSGMSLTRRIT